MSYVHTVHAHTPHAHTQFLLLESPTYMKCELCIVPMIILSYSTGGICMAYGTIKCFHFWMQQFISTYLGFI